MVAMNGSKRGGSAGGRKKVSSRARGGAGSAIEYVKEQTQNATRHVKEGAGELARTIAETAQEEAGRLYQRHKGRAVSRVNRLGKVARQTAYALHAVKADTAAEYLEAASDRVQ